jgi:hypothetical protein
VRSRVIVGSGTLRRNAATSIIARYWDNVTAPGRRPRGLLRVATASIGGSLGLVGALLALGARHGNLARHFSEGRVGTYASGALLIASAVLALAAARRLTGQTFARFWIFTAAGFVFLAADELAMIHEKTDKWIHIALGWDRTNPLTDAIDGFIVALYGLVALVWAWRFRERLLGLRWATLLLSLAFCGFTGTTVLDILELHKATEESLKLATEALIVTGLFAAVRDPALADPPGPGVYFRGL